MPYYAGGNLTGLIRRKKRLKEKIAKIYSAEIILALEDLHSKNIIFRDLKPDNIVLDESGHLKLIDFGLCRKNC